MAETPEKKPVSLEDINSPQELVKEKDATQSQETQEEQTSETEQVEEKTTETSVEEASSQESQEAQETAPEVKETTQETQQTEEQTQQEQIQKSGLDDTLSFLKVINKVSGQTFESEEQVKEAINKPTMESEYGELETKYNDLNEKYDLLAEQLDPLNYFSGEEDLKLQIFKKDNPKRDATIAQKVFSTEDLNTVSDLDMVKMGYKFKAPNLKGDLEATIAEEMGLEPDTPFSEWPVSAQNRLAIKASDFRDQFETIKSSVKLPDRVDIDALRTERKEAADATTATLTEGWTKQASEALKGSNKIKLPIGEPKEGEDQRFFEWDLGAEPKETIEELKDTYISIGMEYNKGNQDIFNEALRLELIGKNLPKIMEQHEKDSLARQKEIHLKETHNPGAIKDTVRPDDSAKDKEIKERTAHVLGSGTSSIQSKPLFKQNK